MNINHSTLLTNFIIALDCCIVVVVAFGRGSGVSLANETPLEWIPLLSNYSSLTRSSTPLSKNLLLCLLLLFYLSLPPHLSFLCTKHWNLKDDYFLLPLALYHGTSASPSPSNNCCNISFKTSCCKTMLERVVGKQTNQQIALNPPKIYRFFSHSISLYLFLSPTSLKILLSERNDLPTSIQTCWTINILWRWRISFK